jgi:predicted nucleic acid-binding protein
MIWYSDSSAVVKRYVREGGSLWLRREVSKHNLLISQITPVEVYAALAVKQRTGT